MDRPPLSKDSNCPCGSGRAYGDCCVPREAAGRAVRGAAPTRFHAETLFEQMVEHLGDRAVVETANGGVLRFLYVRDASVPELVVPWPLATFSTAGRGPGIPITVNGVRLEPPEVDPAQEGEAPRGSGPGSLEISNGLETSSLAYGPDGRCFETGLGRAPAPFDAAASILSARSAPPVDLLSAAFARLDPGRAGPSRVLRPVPFPRLVHDLWPHARKALCAALFDDAVPASARWAAADALSGDAVASGATLPETLAAWRAEVARKNPWLPRAEPAAAAMTPEEAVEAGYAVVGGPTPDAPLPPRSPAAVPGAVIPVPPPPPEGPPAGGSWKGLLDQRGAVSWHATLPVENGFLIVGRDLLASMSLDEVRSRIAGVTPQPMPEHVRHLPGPPLTVRTVVYEVSRPDCGTGYATEFHPHGLDGRHLSTRAALVTWIDPD